MTFDLTKFGKQNPSQPAPVRRANPAPQPEPNEETVPKNPLREAHEKTHWSIDRAFKDGQMQAGAVDDEQKEFLKKTEFVE